MRKKCKAIYFVFLKIMAASRQEVEVVIERVQIKNMFLNTNSVTKIHTEFSEIGQTHFVKN